MERAAFYFLSVIALLGAIVTIARRNAAHAVMVFAPTLFAVAGIFLLQQAVAPFLFLLVIVAGPAAHLLFFRRPAEISLPESFQPRFLRARFSAILATLLLVLQSVFAIFFGARLALRGLFLLAAPAAATQVAKLRDVSHALFENYLLPCEIAVALILIAAVARNTIRAEVS